METSWPVKDSNKKKGNWEKKIHRRVWRVWWCEGCNCCTKRVGRLLRMSNRAPEISNWPALEFILISRSLLSVLLILLEFAPVFLCPTTSIDVFDSFQVSSASSWYSLLEDPTVWVSPRGVVTHTPPQNYPESAPGGVMFGDLGVTYYPTRG